MFCPLLTLQNVFPAYSALCAAALLLFGTICCCCLYNLLLLVRLVVCAVPVVVATFLAFSVVCPAFVPLLGRRPLKNLAAFDLPKCQEQ